MYPGAHLEQHADKPAVIMAGSGWTQTFFELDEAANRLARLLRDTGLQPGDHVAICMENHPRYLEVLWGCNYAGLIYTAASSRLTSEELGYVVDDCGARVLITSQRMAGSAAEIVAHTPKIERRLMLDGAIADHESYEEAVADCDPTPLEGRIAGTDMLYSSGTTGRPKGVLPAVPDTPLEEYSSGVKTLLELLFGMGDTKTYLSPAPLYHAAPLRFCMSVQACGSTVVVMEHFDAEEYLHLIEKYSITHSQVVPTMFVRMLKLPEGTRAGHDVSSLECVIHAAAQPSHDWAAREPETDFSVNATGTLVLLEAHGRRRRLLRSLHCSHRLQSQEVLLALVQIGAERGNLARHKKLPTAWNSI